MTLSIVLAAGGERLVAWQTGVLAGLAGAGVPVGRADCVIGTSAGALVAARLALGADPRDDAERLAREPGAAVLPEDAVLAAFEKLLAAWRAGADAPLAERRRRVGRLSGTGLPIPAKLVVEVTRGRLPDGPWPGPLRLVAIDADAGERVVLGADAGVEPAVGVAASRAVPGVLPPMLVGGRRLMDGAIGSGTNADVAGGDVVVIVTGLPEEPEADSVEALWQAALADEVRGLEARGARPLVIRAGADDRRAMGPAWMDGTRAPLAIRAGRHTGRLFAEAHLLSTTSAAAA